MIGSKNVSQIPDLEITLPDNTCRLLQDNQEKACSLFSTDAIVSVELLLPGKLRWMFLFTKAGQFLAVKLSANFTPERC